MKNIRVKVGLDCDWYDFGIYEGRKLLMQYRATGKIYWRQEKFAIRNAKAMAKRIGIPYDPEIIQQHGC